MEEIPDGWQIVSRRGNYGGWIRTLFYLVAQWIPTTPDTITIKVREASTGIVYSVTADDEREAMAKLGKRNFD